MYGSHLNVTVPEPGRGAEGFCFRSDTRSFWVRPGCDGKGEHAEPEVNEHNKGEHGLARNNLDGAIRLRRGQYIHSVTHKLLYPLSEPGMFVSGRRGK